MRVLLIILLPLLMAVTCDPQEDISADEDMSHVDPDLDSDLEDSFCKSIDCGAFALCDESLRSCVCQKDYHFCSGVCVSSTSPQTCGDRCDPCPAPDAATATCEDGECGIFCFGDRMAVDGACVDCIDNDDCPLPTPRCEAGSCTGCLTDSDCAGKALEVCGPEGRCVECTEDSLAACGANACNPDVSVYLCPDWCSLDVWPLCIRCRVRKRKLLHAHDL